MILTLEDNFCHCFLQEVIAQAYEEFFHNHYDKQLHLSRTNKPDVVVENKNNTKLFKTYTLYDHQPFSTTLNLLPEEVFAVKQPKLACRKQTGMNVMKT